MPIGLTGQQQHVFLGVLLLWVYVLPTEARPQQSDLFKQIDKDLHHFRNGISIEMVEQVYCSNSDQGARRCTCQQLRCKPMLLLQGLELVCMYRIQVTSPWQQAVCCWRDCG